MRWHFGGNLQPVRMICEYDWKECPIAVISYVWSEIVTDVVDSVTGETQLWRILAVMFLCSLLFRTVYYKMRWANKSEHDFARNHLIKVGFKMQDLELKINILTYKMQYGTWPLPHEIPTPSLNELRNVKLTLSNTSRQNMWTKHHLHGYISKFINNKSINKTSPTSDGGDLANQNVLTKFGNRNTDFETPKSLRNLKLLHGENECKDYERLIKTAKECRRYMDEINKSNKSLGLFENSSDVSDQNSVKDICTGTESEENSRRFLVDTKKWHEIYKYKNREDGEMSASDMSVSNQIFSMSNLKHKDSIFSTDDERYPLKSSKNKSRLLPPGLSITFLSDKFETLASSDKRVASEGTRRIKEKTLTNETLNKVTEKLGSLHDIKYAVKNSKSLNNVNGNAENKNTTEIGSMSNKINLNNLKIDKLISSKYDSSSGDNGAAFNSIKPDVFARKIPAQRSNSRNEQKALQIDRTKNQNIDSVHNTMNSTFCDSAGEQNLSLKSGSSASFEVNSTSVQKNDLNSRGLFGLDARAQKLFDLSQNDGKNVENNVNLNRINEIESTPKTSTSYILPPQDKSVRQMSMETDEDATLISQTSSQTELSKDSDMEDKSTTTLLREALEFKKALLIQISKESEIEEKKITTNESSECDSVDTPRSKTDNHFRSKLLDIISEEQSASSSTEKTSRTYVLSRAINGTNICEDSDKYSNKNNNSEDLKFGKVMPKGECCGDSKSVVTVSSSEYFSINNVTDNEHTSAQKIHQSVADGDGLRDLQKSYSDETLENELGLNVVKNHENNNITQKFYSEFELKKDEAKEEHASLKNKSKTSASEESQNIKKGNVIPGVNNAVNLHKNNETCVANSRTLNKLEKVKMNVGDIDKIETFQNTVEKKEEVINSVAERIASESKAKIKLFESLSSIDSEKGISWNSISESSSTESITQFVNALANIESKNIDTVAEQKLMMLNSRDYEGRNFATAGEDLRYDFSSRSKNMPDFGSLSDTSISEHGNGIIEEILEMIADSAIFKSDKSQTIEQNSSISLASNLFKTNNAVKLDQEKLQRKHDIFSKLKTLDAFTKPLEISEFNLEKNENEGDASPLTGRTVVCIYDSNATDIVETASKEEGDVSKDKTSSCPKAFDQLISTDNFQNTKTINENIIIDECEIVQSNKILDVPTASENQLPQLHKRKEAGENANSIIGVHLGNEGDELDTKSNCGLSTDKSGNNSGCDKNLPSKNMISSLKKNQLSISSITNFSTDTSESYFDVSNHDFAVSSIILTSQNSNFVSNFKDKPATSDTSSSYVDASDYCSKIPSDLNSSESNARSKVNTTEAEEINNTANTGMSIKNIVARSNLDLTHESSTKPELIPKCTSSLAFSDKKSQLNEQGKALMKDQLCAESSSSLDQDSSKCCSNMNLEKTISKVRTMSRSCIPILKSRIEGSRRGKSMEAKARSRSPVRRSNTPTMQCGESNSQILSARTRESNNGSRKSLNRKQSYTVPPKNSDTRQKCLSAKPDTVENKVEKILQPFSNELAPTPEKTSPRNALGHLTKECTVIYINIISDSDRNEAQAAAAKEIIKRVDEKDSVPREDVINGNNEEAQRIAMTSFETYGKWKAEMNNSEKIFPPSGSVAETSNKLMSTSTLQLSNSFKVDRREIEVSAKPSVNNTSTSVSDFPDASPVENRCIYNLKNEVFDVSKDFVQKEQIVLSEMLTTNPNFFECKKTHRLYNKLGLGFQEQPDQV